MRGRTGTAQLPLHGGRARDPGRFSFAHGGKDGTPFPVDRDTYLKTVEVLRTAIGRPGIEPSERVKALKRLATFGEERVRASAAQQRLFEKNQTGAQREGEPTAHKGR